MASPPGEGSVVFSRYLGIGIGAWYVVAPFAWGYTQPFNWWHSMVLGAAVLALSASHLVSWSRLAAWLMVAVGAYSMAAPFLHDYLALSRPFFNDLFFGVLTVGTSVALGANAVEIRARGLAG